ncbi:GNAT family N-acetyltransferase [Kribbella sp. NBC_00382]|uniref:GNAT family N-acetyltransferase n=1 Tax=Kribbella sp. NBC_00382 TaxID=2975967 RepID=UPI002E20C5E1
MEIRPARSTDLYGAALTRIASWRAAFTGLVPQDFLDSMDAETISAGWAASIAAGRSRLYVAAATGTQPDCGRILGYAGTGPERDGPAHAGELYALYVHPDAWGSGVGRALLDAAARDLQQAGCTTISLWVLEANERARAFYHRYGFTQTPNRTHSSLGQLPELRLSLDLRTSTTH